MEVKNSQLKRGVLEACVLSALAKGASYGYKIIKEVSAVISVSESTLYPLLKRLERKTEVVCEKVRCNGRMRKYYSVTEKGRERIKSFMSDVRGLAEAISFVGHVAECY